MTVLIAVLLVVLVAASAAVPLRRRRRGPLMTCRCGATFVRYVGRRADSVHVVCNGCAAVGHADVTIRLVAGRRVHAREADRILRQHADLLALVARPNS